MVYLDNSATGGFKPNSVIEAVQTVIKYLSANPGRSGHKLAVTGAEIIFNCREQLARLFNGASERVIFTKNCTEALNLAIFGSLKNNGHVITTVYEHNSVLRPLTHLKESGKIQLDVVSPSFDGDIVNQIKEKIKKNTYLIVTTALSNVTGQSLPIKEIGKLANERGILYLVDGAQAGGHINLNMQTQCINMLALAGHKGLYGIMGSGVLIFDESVQISPLIYGGTGNMSLSLNQPQSYPESLESGTINLPAIAGLLEGVKYISKNIDNFNKHLYSYTQIALDKLSNIPQVNCYSRPNPAGIVSFSIENMSSEDVADRLNKDFDVAVRGGFHCAPLTHKFLNTDKNGLVRASFAVQNSEREIWHLINSVKSLCKTM